MTLLNEAYSVLGDIKKRRGYDIEWQRYYKMKGEVRRTGGDASDMAISWRIGKGKPENYRPDRPVVDRSPWWLDQKILIVILLVLLLFLGIRLFTKFIHPNMIKRPPVIRIGQVYENSENHSSDFKFL